MCRKTLFKLLIQLENLKKNEVVSSFFEYEMESRRLVSIQEFVYIGRRELGKRFLPSNHKQI